MLEVLLVLFAFSVLGVLAAFLVFAISSSQWTWNKRTRHATIAVWVAVTALTALGAVVLLGPSAVLSGGEFFAIPIAIGIGGLFLVEVANKLQGRKAGKREQASRRPARSWESLWRDFQWEEVPSWMKRAAKDNSTWIDGSQWIVDETGRLVPAESLPRNLPVAESSSLLNWIRDLLD